MKNKFNPTRLRDIRTAFCLDISDLSEKAGISAKRLTNIEQGALEPNEMDIERLCFFFSVIPTFFYKENIKKVVNPRTISPHIE